MERSNAIPMKTVIPDLHSKFKISSSMEFLHDEK
ncbi:hypothetical protein CsSME_00045518 [Camellia sinensis var. sinensis]